jgi:S1-C subfamily serine protease/tetratricopeptide (TPR) repeat protein
MKRVMSLLSAVFGVLLLLPSFSYAANSVPEEALAARESVFRVLSQDEEYEYSGSGFVVGSDSHGTYFVTNYHVIEGTNFESISVVLHDGTELPVTVVGYDEGYDLCVLQTSSPLKNTFPLPLAVQAGASVGDAVYALGFPGAGDYLLDDYAYAIEDITVTDGIVSAVKSVTIDTKKTTLLQMNAAINPGSSGGPLVNGKGEVVGVNTLSIWEAQDVYAAVSISHLTGILDQYSVPYETPGQSMAQEPPAGAPMAPWLWAAIVGATLAIAAAVFFIIRARRLTLATLLARRLQGYTPEEALHKLRPVFYALAPLHARGEAHGSIYPANLYVDRAGDLHLGNRHRKNVLNEKTRPYLPMEQYEQQARPGTYSDVYALGAVLLHMLTCAPPPDVMVRLQSDQVEELLRAVPGLPDQVKNALLRSLTIRREERLHDVDQLSRAVESQLRCQPLVPLQNVGPYPLKYTASFGEQSGAVQPLPGGSDVLPVTTAGAPAYWYDIPGVPHKPAMEKKAKRRLALIVCGGALLLAVGVLLCVNESNYRRAVTCIESGEYSTASDAAKKVFLLYKDNSTLCDYISAGLYLQAGYYQDAKDQFLALGDYRDSGNMVKECDYQYARLLLNRHELEAARAAFTALGGYSDAASMVLECDYRQGLDLLKAKQFNEAKAMFDKLSESDYRDSGRMILEVEYQHAKDIYERFVNASSESKRMQPVQLALMFFEELGDYSNSAQMLGKVKDAIYSEAQHIFQAGLHNGFEDLYYVRFFLSMIKDYRDSVLYLRMYDVMMSDESLENQCLSLRDMWNFTPARQVITSDWYILPFLKGTWKGGGCYIKIRQSSDGKYPSITDFPWSNIEGYYQIRDLVWYEGKHEENMTSAFSIEVISEYTIEIYSYKNGKTYTLERQ